MRRHSKERSIPRKWLVLGIGFCMDHFIHDPFGIQ